ncbi:MAG: TolC family protein, partial [candidate division Zixibacteria bacterium]|nr:TolC family protein [candidate division Zixibacteria bacterium]
SYALTLEECIRQALAQNRLLLVGKSRVEAQRSRAGQARSAFYPTLGLSATYTRLGNAPGAVIPAMPPLIPGEREIVIGFKDNYLARLSLNAPLFTWGKIAQPYRIEKERVTAESLQLAQSEEEIKLATTELFWSALALEKNLEVRKKSAESLERHLKTVENKLTFGQASNFEKLRAQVELTNARVPITETEAQLKTLYDRLQNLLVLPVGDTLTLSGELEFTPLEKALSEVVEKAKSNRPELKSLAVEKQLLARAQSLAAVENRPSLSLFSNVEYKNPFNARQVWKLDWNAGAGITFLLFSGFHSRYKVEELEYQKKVLDLTIKETEAQIEQEVRQAFYELDVAAENSAALKENIALAEKALEIAKVQYEAGVITNLEELDAELSTLSAQTAYFSAVSNYLIAKARLEKAAGQKIE